MSLLIELLFSVLRANYLQLQSFPILLVCLLKHYLLTNKISDGPLFVSTSNHGKNQRLITKSIRNILNPIFRQLDIEKSIHSFRHYFVTKMIESYKSNLLTASRYTRHKSLDMLIVYNDHIKHKDDLPRFFATFDQVGL